MKNICAILLLFVSCGSAFAADSMLRVSCEGGDVGAEVLVNGKFRGQCPVDFQVPPGGIKLRVQRKFGADREQFFEDEFRVGESSVKKIEVRLGDTQPTPTPTSTALRQGQIALQSLTKRANAGDAEAMEQLGDLYQSSLVPFNLESSVAWYKKAAEAGRAHAMALLSDRYYEGKGLPESLELGASWRLKAAQAGDVRAMDRLAYYYEKTNKIESDSWLRKATEVTRKAAENNDATAMHAMGMRYVTGSGVPTDETQAADWFRRGADAGNPEATTSLANFYKNGRGGLPKNRERALQLLRKAAELGSYGALIELKNL